MAQNTLETLVEHFGFAPISAIDDVINSVNELLYTAIMGLEQFVLSELKSSEEVDQGIHQVETLLESLVDRHFDMFEIYALRNIFAIPDKLEIVLPHREGMDLTSDQTKEEYVDQELDAMRKKVLAVKAMNYKLKEEISRTDKCVKKLERWKERLSFLLTTAKHYNVSPVIDTVRLVTDQLLAIKRTTTNLQSQVDDEKLKQFAIISDERESFVSTMVLRQTEQMKMQQHEQ
ncbi:Mis12-domain-containing protein [Gigaspora margarita]|uniref:Mis12-domain-containing protein n=1 Tax=Gigaspora margarita TaxID=4874 RepID=A0A8H4ARG3_GIGMA|nr:Mis12-domain-containing protein [Gigaspora margarita]